MGLSVYKQGVCTRESIFQQHVAGSVYVGDLTDPGKVIPPNSCRCFKPSVFFFVISRISFQKLLDELTWMYIIYILSQAPVDFLKGDFSFVVMIYLAWMGESIFWFLSFLFFFYLEIGLTNKIFIFNLFS